VTVELSLPKELEVLRTEIRTYLRELPRMLEEGHEGKHALIKDDQVLSVWDTFEDAYQAGRQLFGWGVAFLTQPIEEEALDYPWPEDLLPRTQKAS
jgi:hypothetical protein